MTEQQIIETLATKVMGWKQIPQRPSGPPEVFPVFYLPVHGDIKDGCIVAYKDADGVIDTAHWNPLQNIADAWQVVEKLLERNLRFDLSADEDDWWATFRRVDKTFIVAKKWEASGDTPQEAICTAALELAA